MPVQLDLKRIIINEVHDQQVIMLRESEGERSFPIVIGFDCNLRNRHLEKKQWK